MIFCSKSESCETAITNNMFFQFPGFQIFKLSVVFSSVDLPALRRFQLLYVYFSGAQCPTTLRTLACISLRAMFILVLSLLLQNSLCVCWVEEEMVRTADYGHTYDLILEIHLCWQTTSSMEHKLCICALGFHPQEQNRQICFCNSVDP